MPGKVTDSRNCSAGRKNPLWLCIRIVSAKVVIENIPLDFNRHLFVGSVFVSILCTLGMRIFKVFEQLEVFCVSRSFKQLTSCFTTSRLISGDTRVYFCFCPLRPFPLRLFFPCPCLLQLPGFFSFFFRPFRPSKKIVIIGKGRILSSTFSHVHNAACLRRRGKVAVV